MEQSNFFTYLQYSNKYVFFLAFLSYACLYF